MPTETTGANTPPRKTTFTKFFSCNPQQDALFAINGDIAADDALEMAPTFLSAAEDSVRSAAVEADSGIFWSALYLVEISRALVNATIGAVMDEERNHG